MRTIQQQFTVNFSYPVIFSSDIFAPENNALLSVLPSTCGTPHRAVVVIDSEVARLHPLLIDRIRQFSACHSERIEFVAPPLVARGGEACKHEPVEVEKIHALVERHALCRHSFIIVIGGGAVLDASGYAAATAHRGIRLIRVPSTVLAQNDAGVGVKNGINAFGRKNFLGTFTPPFAVINDSKLLETLSPRDLRAGIAEAVKVALIRDGAFFDKLYAAKTGLAAFDPQAMEEMIVGCARLHLNHISEGIDPFETGSSRPLDFGHWAAHKLEELSGGDLRHGEAVAIGIALDTLYSRKIGLLGDLDQHRIITLLEEVGFSLYHPALSWVDVEKALREFQEHLGGQLTIPLLEGIGKKIDVHHVDLDAMKGCIAALKHRNTAKGAERDDRKCPAVAETVG